MYVETATPHAVPKKVLVTIAGALAVLALVAVVDHGKTSPTSPTAAATELSSPPPLIYDEGSDDYLTSTAYVSSRCAMQNDEDELNAGASHGTVQTWCKNIEDPSKCASSYVNVWKQKTTAPCVWLSNQFEQNGITHRGNQCTAQETCKDAKLDADQQAALDASEKANKQAKEAAKANSEEKATKAKEAEEAADERMEKARPFVCAVLWYVPKVGANRYSGPWGSTSGLNGPIACDVTKHCPNKTPEECCKLREEATHSCGRDRSTGKMECGGQCIWRN